jgi:hypothetical protein
MRATPLVLIVAAGALGAACAGSSLPSSPSNSATTSTLSFKANPCGSGGTVQLAVAQAARVDCSNGGTTITLAGAGASYLIVPQFATDLVPDQFVPYTLFSGTATAVSARLTPSYSSTAAAGPGVLPTPRKNPYQLRWDAMMRARTRAKFASGGAGVRAQFQVAPARPNAQVAPPAVGSLRTFHVASSFSTIAYATVGARLAYAGTGVLVYVDTLAPTNGFTAAQLTSFGQLFDQTLYGIDTAAFGAPSDVDGNGHVIMLMSPYVNADTPTATCQQSGYVAGFFDTNDFDGPSNTTSNHGEIFYSIVPDPSGKWSCAHPVSDLTLDVPGTFLHELQHLINFSQHVVVSGGQPASDWMDEGMSIVAEELGSLYYERKYPPPTGRTNASQIFPDSAEGFASGFLYDSYEFALVPDTASVTLHSDADDGFAWRGGDWAFMRWLGDQVGGDIYKRLERGPSNGVADVEQSTGQTFPSLFANFGLALYTDSLPGLPRTTAPAANRFTTRNLRQLWARLYATAGPAADIPLTMPLQLFSIGADTSTYVLDPGTMTYFRLDTPSTAATTSIRFSAPGGGSFSAVYKPQVAIFRLPPGQ